MGKQRYDYPDFAVASRNAGCEQDVLFHNFRRIALIRADRMQLILTAKDRKCLRIAAADGSGCMDAIDR
jgi:hypothetical protein